MRFLILLIALLSLNAFGAQTITPKFKPVDLKEFTSLKLKVMPDTATQLIFPFELDNPELTPKLKIKLSNSDGFWVPTTKEELTLLKGQNTLNILGLANAQGGTPKYLGNLNISIGGYNLSIALETTYKPKDVITNIIFNIDESKREHMIEKSVKRFTDNIEKEYQQKFDDLDILAREEALKYVGEIAIYDPDFTSYKYETETLIDGNRVVVYIDEIASFDDKFHIMSFEVENYSSVDFNGLNLDLTGKRESGEINYRGSFNCPKRIKSDGKYTCTFATQDRSILDTDEFKMTLTTDRGQGAITW